MLVKGIMTKKVVTIPSNTSIGDAQRILKEHGFRRLPVVDNGNLVGIVTGDRLERVSPSATAPVLWQISYLISHTTVGDIMVKDVVTIAPEATVEQAVAIAQTHRVGSLVVVKNRKVEGIVTTNDFFYKIVNPTLGIGESGTRILINGGGDGKAAEKIIHCINSLGVGIKLIWTSPSSTADETDITLQLDTEDVSAVIKELATCGYEAMIRQR